MKQVAQAIDENLSRAFPLKWLFQLPGHEEQIKAVLKGVSQYSTEPLGENRRAVKRAARAHFRAVPERVPDRVCHAMAD